MSAREELFEAMMPLYRAQYARGEEESTNALLDAYRDEVAHELAEQQREWADAISRDPVWPGSMPPGSAVREGADMIDPEVDS